ncbi:hypothetical protein SMICM304S_09588 [Streptomyces microflavus]
MSNVSDTRSDISGHPDASEMRARYDRVMGGRDVALVDAPVFLVGLYCAVSPWVLHFTASQPALVTHNLVMGIAIAVLALGFTIDARADVRPELGDVRHRCVDHRVDLGGREQPRRRSRPQQHHRRRTHGTAGPGLRRSSDKKPQHLKGPLPRPPLSPSGV